MDDFDGYTTNKFERPTELDEARTAYLELNNKLKDEIEKLRRVCNSKDSEHRFEIEKLRNPKEDTVEAAACALYRFVPLYNQGVPIQWGALTKHQKDIRRHMVRVVINTVLK